VTTLSAIALSASPVDIACCGSLRDARVDDRGEPELVPDPADHRQVVDVGNLQDVLGVEGVDPEEIGRGRGAGGKLRGTTSCPSAVDVDHRSAHVPRGVSVTIRRAR